MVQCCGEVTQFYVITGPFNSSAFGVTQDNNGFRSRYLGGKLKAAKDIGVYKISCNACVEDVADPLIKYDLCRNP